MGSCGSEDELSWVSTVIRDTAALTNAVSGLYLDKQEQGLVMKFGKLVASLAALAFAGCMADESQVSDEAGGHPAGTAGTPSDRGIQPVAYYGNFSTVDDDQICYELSELGGWDVTEEMHGVKVDPPVSSSSIAVNVTITQPYLAWMSKPGWQVLAFVVKGGPNYNLYNYGPNNPWTSDGHLHSPFYRKNLPFISHYNYCYQPTTPPSGNGSEGCTPGYWRNHADRWIGASPSDLYDATFGITSTLGATYTLGMGIWDGGGGEHALARHATAGLLNSFGGVPNVPSGEVVNYPYSTAEVKAIVQAAYATDDDPYTPQNEHADAIEAAKNQLANANELGCPLGGTSADKVD